MFSSRKVFSKFKIWIRRICTKLHKFSQKVQNLVLNLGASMSDQLFSQNKNWFFLKHGIKLADSNTRKILTRSDLKSVQSTKNRWKICLFFFTPYHSELILVVVSVVIHTKIKMFCVLHHGDNSLEMSCILTNVLKFLKCVICYYAPNSPKVWTYFFISLETSKSS